MFLQDLWQRLGESGHYERGEVKVLAMEFCTRRRVSDNHVQGRDDFKVNAVKAHVIGTDSVRGIHDEWHGKQPL